MTVGMSVWSWMAILCAVGGSAGLSVLACVWMWCASERRRPVPPRRWVDSGEASR